MKTRCFGKTPATAFLLAIGWFTQGGCHVHSPEVTAVPLSPWNRHEPCGIPYYLPKPLLVVSKNVRHIDSSKVGLTDPAPIPDNFDHQAEYADVKANVTNPSAGASNTVGNTTYQAAAGTAGAVPKQAAGSLGESVAPDREYDNALAYDSFFTYQIIFVPDLSQKYGLRIKGGSGEIRAAMNMVNGWMFTGLGPFYLKDSSTAQNRMATGIGAMFAGRGVADVTEAVGDLLSNLPKEAGFIDDQQLQNFAKALEMIRSQSTTKMVQDQTMDFAEIYIYEPHLTPDGHMQWELLAHHIFNREFLRTEGGISPEVMQTLLNTVQPKDAGDSANSKEAGLIDQYAQLKAAKRAGTSKEAGGLAGGSGVNVDVRVGDETNVDRAHPKLFGRHRRKKPQFRRSFGTTVQGAGAPTGSLPSDAQSRSSDETGGLTDDETQFNLRSNDSRSVAPSPPDFQLGSPGHIPQGSDDDTEELPSP